MAVGHRPVPGVAAGRPLTILVVGGNERQERVQADVEKAVREHHGEAVTLEWYVPCWTANWSRVGEQVERRYGVAGALVLMKLVPTLLGRRLRKSAGAAGIPWVACAGRGRGSLERAVDEAVALVRE